MEARQHVQVLQNTLNAAQAAADHVTQAANEAAGELAAQQAMVGSAKDRLEQIGKQLAAVRIDFQATQAAAQKAQASAQAAAANAAAAAAAAAAGMNNQIRTLYMALVRNIENIGNFFKKNVLQLFSG